MKARRKEIDGPLKLFARQGLKKDLYTPKECHAVIFDMLEKKAIQDANTPPNTPLVPLTDFIQIFHLRKYGMPALSKVWSICMYV